MPFIDHFIAGVAVTLGVLAILLPTGLGISLYWRWLESDQDEAIENREELSELHLPR